MTLELNLRFPDPKHLIVSLECKQTNILDFVSPITGKDREEIRWYIETYAALYTTDVDDAEARRIETKLPKWGSALFDAIFHDRAAQRLYNQFQSTTSQDRLLTISAKHPAILSLPWELLRDPNGVYFLSENPRISIRRVAESTSRRRAFGPKTKLRLHLLFVTSRPAGSGFIDPRADPQAVMDAVEQYAPGRIDIEFLRPATFRNLADRLENKSLPTVDVIHFDGHGEFDIVGNFGDGTPNTGYLLFENKSGLKQYISPKFWHDTIGDGGLSLVVLSACQSAAMGDNEDNGEAEEPMGSVAYGLTALGIPAVLAMSHSVLATTTEQLFGEFYRHLAEGKGIGVALDNARHHLMLKPEKHEVQRGTERIRLTLQDWFLPALYQIGKDVPLLDARANISLTDLADVGNEVFPPASTKGNSGLSSEPPKRQEAGFFGRQRELWELERYFIEGSRRISITGFGGQGKTYLAAEAGRWLQRTGMFGRVAFVTYTAFQGIDAVGYAVAILSNALQESLVDADAAAAVLRRVPALIILDNLEDLAPAPLAELLTIAKDWSECGDSRILITSRTPHVAESKKHHRLALAGLGEQDALNYFQSLMMLPPTPQLLPPDRETLLKLFKMVNFHPLSLRLLAEQLKTRHVEELGERLEALLVEVGRDKDKCLLASLILSLDRLDLESWQTLPCLGVLQGGAMENGLMLITEAQLRFIQGNFGIHMLGNVSIGESKWTAMREQLEAAALIAFESLDGVGFRYVRFHPTLAPLLWSLLPQTERDDLTAKHRLWYYQLSNYLYYQDLQHPNQMRSIARRELPNLLHAVQGALKAGEEWAVRFSYNVVYFLRLFGLNLDATALTEQIAAWGKNGLMGNTESQLPWHIQSSKQEMESEAWRLTQSNRGTQLLQNGDFKAAIVVYQEILDSLGNSPSFDRCSALDDLGRCFQDMGQLDRAEIFFRDALALVDVLEQTDIVNWQRAMGEPDCAKHQRSLVQTDLGNVLMAMGRYEEARAAYYSVLEISKDLGDLRSEGVVITQLGGLALVEGDLQEAADRYQEAISFYQRLPEPAGEAVAWHELGRVYQNARKWDDAERCYRESARITESLGDLIRVAGTWDQLAQISELSGKFQAAEAWFGKALQARRQMGDVVGLALTLSNLAALLQNQSGRLDETRKLAEESLAIQQSLDPGAAGIWNTYTILAEIADKQNNPSQGREYRRQARAAWRNFDGSRHELERHEPLIAAVITTVFQPQHRLESEPVLTAMEQQGKAALVTAIRCILDGQRDAEVLCESLGVVDSDIVEVILNSIKDPANVKALLVGHSLCL